MESRPNRFADGEDLAVDDCDLKQLMSECEKWSHKNDLQLLSHLKQISNHLINKTENTNESIDSLVFGTKIHCVKVDNVINEFQMLANSQFVENRVYDEEMEDIITGNQNQNEESVHNKSKDEEILNKIKIALNIGLDFLNERFDCISNKVTQNDSDDENDEILEGLISNSARDVYSQRLLPYIIGSNDFIKDNYVGLNYVEENPTIDLTNNRIETDLSVKSIDSYETRDTFEASNAVLKSTVSNLIDNESDEESNDLFGTLPISQKPKSVSISDESESEKDPFIPEVKPTTKLETSETNPSVPSFQDELSAALLAKNSDKNSLFERKESSNVLIANNSQSRSPPILESEGESSDENDSIFNINKTKPKVENKYKNNFDNLFGDETNEDLFSTSIDQKQSAVKQTNKVISNSKIESTLEKPSTLFDDDDEEDDLFGAVIKKITKSSKPVSIEEKVISNSSVSETKEPNVSNPFSDEEEDDLFGSLSSKSKQNVQNSDSLKPEVKSTAISDVKTSKPTDSLISELSSALKKKKLFQSSDEESDSNEDINDFKFTNDSKTKTSFPSEIESEKIVTPFRVKSLEENEENNSLLIEDNNSLKKSDVKETTNLTNPKPSDDSNSSNTDFYSEEPTHTLANEGLKHRAVLAAQRNRRPPTKKILKLTPITDFDPNPEVKQETNVEERIVHAPSSSSIKSINEKSDKQNELKRDDKMKSISTLLKSPSTEEDDIFPTQTIISKNQNISKIFDKSENKSTLLFNDFEDKDDSLFSSNKTIKNEISKRVDNNKGLFDTSDSDDDNFLNNSSNVISNIIKPSNSDVFNDVSSTDSSLSNKSDLKVGNSKPSALSLFSDSDDEDLFSAVTKNKSNNEKLVKSLNNKTEDKLMSNESPQKFTKSNSLFSDDEENSDLFQKKGIQTTIQTTKPKTKVKPIFDLDDDDDDEDIFSSKTSTTKTSSDTSKNKLRKESQSSDLFDDPLFVSRS